MRASGRRRRVEATRKSLEMTARWASGRKSVSTGAEKQKWMRILLDYEFNSDFGWHFTKSQSQIESNRIYSAVGKLFGIIRGAGHFRIAEGKFRTNRFSWQLRWQQASARKMM